MTEKPELEEILEIILAFSEGTADKETIDKVRSLAEKIKEKPDYNQVKALEYAIRTIFDKICEKCPAQKLNYKFGNPISIGDLTISTSSNENTPFPNNRVITVSYPTNLASILHASIDKPAWEYLHAYLNMKLISDTFNKKEFAKQLLKLKIDKNILPGSIIDLDLLKAYLPMEEEKKKENEPENIDELLKVILVVSEGISDAKTIDNLRSFAEKQKINPDYNQIKALEHTVLTIFDKTYEKCPVPKTDYIEDRKVPTDSKPKSKIRKFILGGVAAILMFYGGYMTYLNIQDAPASKSATEIPERKIQSYQYHSILANINNTWQNINNEEINAREASGYKIIVRYGTQDIEAIEERAIASDAVNDYRGFFAESVYGATPSQYAQILRALSPDKKPITLEQVEKARKMGETEKDIEKLIQKLQENRNQQ